MNQGRRNGEKLAERRIGHVPHALGQAAGNLVRVPRQQQPAAAEKLTGPRRFGKELMARPHRRAGGERDGRFAGVEKLLASPVRVA